MNQCDVCNEFYGSAREVAAHKARTVCGTETRRRVRNNIDPNVTEIEGYSLNYVVIPPQFFNDLENEQTTAENRGQTLINFANATHEEYYSRTNVIKRDLYEFIRSSLLSVSFAFELLCILSLLLAFYYSSSGNGSLVNYFIIGIEQ